MLEASCVKTRSEVFRFILWSSELGHHSLTGGYQYFGRTYCLYLQGYCTLKNKAVRSFKTQEITCQSTWHHRPRENNEYMEVNSFGTWTLKKKKKI